MEDVDVEQLQRVAEAVRPRFASSQNPPQVSTIMAAILLAADDSMSSRAACRAAGIKESTRDQVAQLAAKVPRVLEEAGKDGRDGMTFET